MRGESASGARFVHLHCHSQYSPAIGCCQVEDLGSVCLELMDNGLPLQRKINLGLLTLGQEMGVPVVATNDVQYIDQHFEKEPIVPDLCNVEITRGSMNLHRNKT